jgi:hypothetical protein
MRPLLVGGFALPMADCWCAGATINNSPKGSQALAAAKSPRERMPSSLVMRMSGWVVKKISYQVD